MKQTETRSALNARLRRIAQETDEHEAALTKLENEREQVARALAALDELEKELGKLPATVTPAGGKRANGVKARTFEIVRNSKEPVASADIVKMLGVPSSEVYKQLSSLAAEGKIERLDRGMYRRLQPPAKAAA